MEWLSEFGAIAAMQGFNGLSVFCVLLLMALGLAIIFGQMGVINMAHGEFLTIGAYTTYVVSVLTEQYAPFFGPYYFFLAIVLSFFIAGAIGWLAEWAMISKLYQRPLDTLLATWGLSLVMQQAFRSIFGAREVSATLPEWLMGSWNPTEAIDIPRNGLFVMGLTVLMTGMIFLMLYRSRWGLQVRATVQNRVMSRAVGINTKKVDRMTFALGCGVAGVAGAAFTTIGSTGPTAGSLYIVDTFLVVVFGGASSLLGTIASAFSIAQAQSLMEFFMSGSMAKVFTLSAVILILMLRPQGLFSIKVRK
ncbi:amino acid/amide ABC transporter membrane protein 1, HAAT family [Pseudomonas peli]|jgi:urea transport system permease protein|uniref:Amino acid/amide ABC transporter membrane protein 1, HAAT family n=1 Tax=Pseudomonas peli TaxID=592361 RepID=A0AB37Z4S9_9PSED|nr:MULTISPECIES: urea ABC transporter permease subunit UrtB [Pseudomonas]OHC26479.1 MAG: urea ABC transporter permease subunit UrtB [Pseudomonadales bacterium RIFCSPHIGHO2_02_FULL_60_43]MDR7023421.1 urea transport system permease protein [Pseudomonas peli]NMZ68550.1 urea ABC transporter permease subunit UrtB [Pseudomonas peli]WNF46138.1 urea ABC transporter permease subunit UrtB [Pseudomonas sp. SG20056]SCW43255.1 amino acid/amide ABC transporter membrane protein 1, HAAT family [Pseudomonas pe|tara:strand:- start:1066 stop:1983 length:918 start_codon:yes stop_codon:yes gene_type:complete